MDRINGAGHVGHMFVAENVDASQEPTEVTATWLNGVQEEMVAPIIASGQALDAADNALLFKAIKIIGRRMMGAQAVAGGTVDAITAVFDPVVTALVDGMTLAVHASGANTSATPTFAPGAGVAAKTIVKGLGAPLLAGDIEGAGYWMSLRYDGAADKWVLLNAAPQSVPDSTDVIKGKTRVVTAAVDNTFADNSTSAASTGWIRGAMLAIATAAGFAVSLATNGYIKFPTWLGGFVMQWGANSVNFDSYNITFPLAFPNEAIGCWGGNRVNDSTMQNLGGTSLTTTGVSGNAAGVGTQTLHWFAFGY